MVLDGPPQALNENVVLAAATTVHADLNIVFLENSGKVLAGKLATLIGIENIRPPISIQGFL